MTGQSNSSGNGLFRALIGQTNSEAGRSAAMTGQSKSEAGQSMNADQSNKKTSQSSPPTNGKATRLERQSAIAGGSNGAVSEIGSSDIIIDVRPSRMEHKKSTESEV